MCYGEKVSEEFKEKYKGWANFDSCLSSKGEGKRYGIFDDEFFLELYAATNTDHDMLVVVMGEDGSGVHRLRLTRDRITKDDLY